MIVFQSYPVASVQWSRKGEQELISRDRARVDLKGQGMHVLILDSPKQVQTSDVKTKKV